MATTITTIEDGFKMMKDNPSNVNEHIPTLAEYTEKCSSVVELGVNEMNTTWAFLKGLRFNKKKKKVLTCVDIQDKPAKFKGVQELAKKNQITMDFIKGNSTEVDIPKTDLLFIDTNHYYAHLIRELEKHHDKVNKYIIMHNTEIDGRYGEIVRMCYYYDVEATQKLYGYSIEDMCKGLGFAIDEFLKNHPEWTVEKHFNNNNGLTILRRNEDSDE